MLCQVGSAKKRVSATKRRSSAVKKRKASTIVVVRRSSGMKRMSPAMKTKIEKRMYRLKKMLSEQAGGMGTGISDKMWKSSNEEWAKMKGGSSMKKYSKKSCPRGSVSRKSFTRKTGVKVPATCVKSKGVRSKGLKPKVIFPKLKEGSLLKYGYNLHESDKLRHEALKKAVKKYGFSTTIKKLNAVRVLSKNIAPQNSKIYKKDIRYIEKNFATMP